MKKYKHKLTGNIAVETNSENNYKVSEPRHFTIPKWVIENSSDWEEVIEKDYRIISITTNTFMGLTYSGLDIQAFEENCTGTKNWSIHSIKNLKTDEIFTVEDETTKGKIIRIEICANTFGLYTDLHDYWNGLNTISKVKRKPLFKTTDGVDMYVGDEYWFLTTMRGLVNLTVLPEHKPSEFKDNMKRFSTEKAGKDYLLMNTPCLSINEILDSITAKNAFKHKWLYDCKESVSILKDVVKEKNV